jgi:hypothetical protein
MANIVIMPYTNTKKTNIKVIKKLHGLSPQATVPTERPPLVSEVSANFLRIEGATWSA